MEENKKLNINDVLAEHNLNNLRIEQHFHKEIKFESDNDFQNIQKLSSELNHLFLKLMDSDKADMLFIEDFNVMYSNQSKIGRINFKLTNTPF